MSYKCLFFLPPMTNYMKILDKISTLPLPSHTQNGAIVMQISLQVVSDLSLDQFHYRLSIL